jgi:hypothetical protein
MTTNDDKNFTDFTANFTCEFCSITCSRRSEWNRHINTKKHNAYKMTTKISPISPISPIVTKINFECVCGKKYSDRKCLWRHKKTCTNDSKGNEQFLTSMILDIVKSNNALQQQMMEMCKNGLNSNNTTNSHNKTFNLNVFLNEDCKDAMNMKDFVDSIQLQYSDLENVGRLGFVNGISDIIIKNLKALDIHKRPVHCADLKREIMYVKDENQWKKEEDNTKIRRAIKCIAQKNSKNLVLFKQKHPDCLQGDSRSSDRYNKLMVEAFGGGKVDDATNEDKIIRRISKEVTIDKTL